MTTEDSGLTKLDVMGDAWATRGFGKRAVAVREGAGRLRSAIDAMPAVVSVRTLPITTFLYPNKYALWAAALSPAPFVELAHRATLVQFKQNGALKTLLFNPTDPDRARQTPFFARTIEQFGQRLSDFMITRSEPVDAQLARLGVTPESVDYVAFDHFHTQDVRGLLGTTDGRLKARFPNAKLLAPQAEWDDWASPSPMQSSWVVVEGRRGAIEDRVVLTRDDLVLGDGVMLIRTPGHTVGNQTLFFKTDRGVWGVSENGTSADNWSPRASRIAGVAHTAKLHDYEVVLNANTAEDAATQYSAMLLEKTVVDRVAHNDDFVQMFPSSELLASVKSPGVSPTYQHHRIEHGAVTRA